MEDKGQENSRELVQGNEFRAKCRRGEGPRTITDYLFPDLPFNRISSDETIEGLSVEEENALVGMVHFFLQARYDEAFAEAERCRSSRHSEIRDFALMAHAVINVGQHKIEVALNDLQVLQRTMQHPENRRVAALNDCYRYALSVFFFWVRILLRLHLKVFHIVPRELDSLCCTLDLTHFIFSRNMSKP